MIKYEEIKCQYKEVEYEFNSEVAKNILKNAYGTFYGNAYMITMVYPNTSIGKEAAEASTKIANQFEKARQLISDGIAKIENAFKSGGISMVSASHQDTITLKVNSSMSIEYINLIRLVDVAIPMIDSLLLHDAITTEVRNQMINQIQGAVYNVNNIARQEISRIRKIYNQTKAKTTRKKVTIVKARQDLNEAREKINASI